MKKILLLVLLIAGCGGPQITQAPRLSPVEMVFSNTVAFMNEYPNNGEETEDDLDESTPRENKKEQMTRPILYKPYCSGVWVTRDLILTANHCAAGINMIRKIQSMGEKERFYAHMMKLVQLDRAHTLGTEMNYIVENESNGFDGKPKFSHKGKVVAVNDEHDLALIKVDSLSAPQHQTARLAAQNPPIASDLMTVGHPGGLIFSILKVSVAGYRAHISDEIEKKGTTGPFIQVSGQIWKGNSGGGLFNERGELVGLVSFLAYAPGQCFGISIENLKDFLDRNSHKIYL